MRAAAGPATEVVDLAGRLVLPGFTDAHVHPVQGGVERLGCDLTGALDAADALDRVARFAAGAPRAGLDRRRRLAEGALPRRPAHRGGPGPAVPDRPVVLRDNSHHAVWVNSAALRIAGAPTGSARARCTRRRWTRSSPHLPAESLDEQVAGLLEAQRYLHSLGITGWQDAIVGDYAGHGDPTDAYLAVAARGLLTARVVGALWFPRGTGADQLDDVSPTWSAGAPGSPPHCPTAGSGPAPSRSCRTAWWRAAPPG